MNTRTTFSITAKLAEMENKILDETGLSRAAYHRKAIQKYLDQENPSINERLLIRQKSNPEYVRKSVIEPVYLSLEDREALENKYRNGIFGSDVGIYSSSGGIIRAVLKETECWNLLHPKGGKRECITTLRESFNFFSGL